MKTYIVVVLLALSAFAQAGKVYIYKDATGKTVYSDLPPQSGEFQQKKLAASVIDTSGYPYEVQQAIKKFPVVLWGAGCGSLCDKARGLLTDRGIPFDNKDPGSSSAQLEAFKKLSGGDSIPVLQVGTRLYTSFLPDAWHSALSAAGYPKTANKAMRPATASTSTSTPAP